MRVALIADAFPPVRTSGAVQLRDLSREFIKQGHDVTVMIPDADIDQPWMLENTSLVGWASTNDEGLKSSLQRPENYAMDSVQVLRLKAPRTKDINYVRRTVGEFLMPFAMLRNLRKSPLADKRWDGVVWYSPTIFLGPMAKSIKQSSACRSYLIIRDIFPEWAVDMGLMGKGLPYQFFKTIANYQYSVADVIGAQTYGNLAYFTDWAAKPNRRVEVLQNWLMDVPNTGCGIKVSDTILAGRKIFVYAGNMGVAQGMDILLDLAERLKPRSDIGFLFVGRGSHVHQLRVDGGARGLDNVVFLDEIDPDEIPGLYAQCHVGLVALDPRHKTHNIPGKFLSYMQSGLPVLASINPGNDLVDMIEREKVGRVCTDASVESLKNQAEAMILDVANGYNFHHRCKALGARLFSPEIAVKQIVDALRA